MIIRITYPPTQLGQTGGNWRWRAKLIKQWREKWHWELYRYAKTLQGKSVFKINFAPPDKRRRDLTNCQVALKCGLDAMSSISGIDDSKFRVKWGDTFLPPVAGGGTFIEVIE